MFLSDDNGSDKHLAGKQGGVFVSTHGVCKDSTPRVTEW